MWFGIEAKVELLSPSELLFLFGSARKAIDQYELYGGKLNDGQWNIIKSKFLSGRTFNARAGKIWASIWETKKAWYGT